MTESGNPCFARKLGIDRRLIVVLGQNLIGHACRPEGWHIGIELRIVAGATKGGIALPRQRHPARDVAGTLRIEGAIDLQNDLLIERFAVVRLRLPGWPMAYAG